MAREHVRVECRGDCRQPYGCMLCNLFLCADCNCFEGSLPTECPGAVVSEDHQQLIYKGTLDFRGGSWVRRPYWPREKRDPTMEARVDAAAALLNVLREPLLTDEQKAQLLRAGLEFIEKSMARFKEIEKEMQGC